MRLLCDAGAGLELKDVAGFTALTTAVAHQHLEVAEVLLGYGADADAEVLSTTEKLNYVSYVYRV